MPHRAKRLSRAQRLLATMPHIVAELPVGKAHPYMHVAVADRHARAQARKGRVTQADPVTGRPVVPIDWEHIEKLVDRYKYRILRIMKANRYTARGSREYREWSMADIAERITETRTRRVGWTTEIAIYESMKRLALAKQVQYRTVNAVGYHRRTMMMEDGPCAFREPHIEEQTRWVLVKQKGGYKPGAPRKRRIWGKWRYPDPPATKVLELSGPTKAAIRIESQ